MLARENGEFPYPRIMPGSPEEQVIRLFTRESIDYEPESSGEVLSENQTQEKRFSGIVEPHPSVVQSRRLCYPGDQHAGHHLMGTPDSPDRKTQRVQRPPSQALVGQQHQQLNYCAYSDKA
jgi:hypothetical protein